MPKPDPDGSTDDSADADRADDAPTFVLVAAVAENGVIGADSGMPWHYPADLAQFKELTTGHPVVVGRTTYESIVDRIGGPLPERTSVVLSTRDLDLPEGAVLADGVDEAVDRAVTAATDHGVDTVYVIGGATVYEAFLPLADRMVLTEIPERPDGDTYFPEWDEEAWTETDRESPGGEADNSDPDDDLAFVTYDRVTE